MSSAAAPGAAPAVGAAASALPQPLAARLLTQMRRQPKLPLLLAGAAALAVVIALLLWAREPEYRILFSNLGEADGGRILTELEKRQIPYRFSEGGHALMVPADKLHTLRLQLAEQGLPQGGNVGFELLDKQSFGVSQFTEQVNFQRGLEGELARTIESLGPVARARVHLALAKQSVFVRDREPARASVVLNLESGRELGDSQVSAITHLVSSSVPDLPVDAVTVVDQNGRLLSHANGASDLDGRQLNYIDEVERSYRRRIENILIPILGPGNVRAQVVAQIDFANREQTAERYAPNQGEAAVRSEQRQESTVTGDKQAQGVPGALSNSPPNTAQPAPAAAAGAPANAPGAAGGNAQAGAANGAETAKPAGPTSVRRDDMVNYEVDRSVEHVRQSLGSIQRLSAAVVVNYRPVTKDGETSREPLSEEELARIDRLVRQAMGFSASRGDQLEVLNSAFADPAPEPEPAWWRTPEFYNLTMSLSRYLLVAFVALLLWLLVLRPLKRRHEAELAAVQAQREEEQAAASAANNVEEAPAVQRERRRKSTLYEHNLQSLREMAQEDPRMVAMIIRGWMSKKE